MSRLDHAISPIINAIKHGTGNTPRPGGPNKPGGAEGTRPGAGHGNAPSRRRMC